MNVVQAFARMQHCRDLAAFYRRWVATETAGLTLRAALPGLREGAVDIVKTRVVHLRHAIERGDLEIQASTDGFTAVEVAFINVGMTTGNLEGALGSLADMYEADYRTVLRAKRKATYPMMMAFCACWIPTFPIAFFVGPITWICVATVCTGGVFTLGGVVLWKYFVWLRAKPRWTQVRYFWALATSLEAGLALDQALSMSAEAAAPSKLSDSLRYLASNGRPVAELLRRSGVFDEGALSLIEGGEVVGKLPGSLRQAAGYLESGTL